MLLTICVARVEAQQKTDSELDGLDGAVKSAATTVTRSPVKWTDPNGIALIVPIRCLDCADDPDGTKTLSGQSVDGAFAGQVIMVSRDGNGHVTGKVISDSTTEQPVEQDVMGPFGKTEVTFYQNGKPCGQQKISYDQNGHQSEFLSLDCEGKQQGMQETRSNKDGQWTQRTYWGKEDEMIALETYDPETDQQHFTSFDRAGAVKLTWIYRHGEVISFWEVPESKGHFGDFFFSKKDNGDRDSYQCQTDHCDRSRVHVEYLDTAKRYEKSAERRDVEEHTMFGAYYEYELDSAGNWTARRVWVTSSEIGERTLYETDARTIEYWNK